MHTWPADELRAALAEVTDAGEPGSMIHPVLRAASRVNDSAALGALLEAGADPAARDEFGNSALYYARNARHERAADNAAFLLEAARRAGVALGPATDPAGLATLVESYADAEKNPGARTSDRQSTFSHGASARMYKWWELRAVYARLVGFWNDFKEIDLAFGEVSLQEAARRAAPEEYEEGWKAFLAGYRLELAEEGGAAADEEGDYQVTFEYDLLEPGRGDFDSVYELDGDEASLDEIHDNFEAEYESRTHEEPTEVDVPGAGLVELSPSEVQEHFMEDLRYVGLYNYLLQEGWQPADEDEPAWPYEW